MSKDVWMRSAKHGSLWFLMIIFVLAVFALFSYNDLTVEESLGAMEEVGVRSEFDGDE